MGRTNIMMRSSVHWLLCLLFILGLTACLKAELPPYGADRNAAYIVRSGDTL